MKTLRTLLIVMLVTSFVVVLQPADAQGSLSCRSYASGVSGVYPATPGTTNGMYGPFEAAVYTFEFTYIEAQVQLPNAATMLATGGPTVRLVADASGATTLAGPTSVPGTLTYAMPASGQPDGLGFYVSSGARGGSIRVSVSCSAGGCDSMVKIPSQAVVGHFNENSELYWAPGELVSPATVVEIGNTYYVAGQDASGMYRKVLVSCTWVWVRAETVGPNYDEVWQGMPLPTDVVD